MICPNCQRENQAESRFCSQCGHSLDSRQLPTLRSGRYRAVRLVGEGASKRVYEARDEQLSRNVAVSMLKAQHPGAHDSRTALEREAHAMARLSGHPNIVTIYDVGTEGGEVYLIGQLMEGGDLATILSQRPGRRLGVAEALRVAEDVLRGLEHAHRRGVIHRDIKPANLFLDADGNALIGDFGLARAESLPPITEDGVVVGTFAYMAPELAFGAAATPSSDIYSVGVTFYELLTGSLPFAAASQAGLVFQHLNANPVAASWHNPEVPRPLDRILERLLAKRPEDRPSAETAAAEIAGLAARLQRLVDTTGPDRINPLGRIAGGVIVGREVEIEQGRQAVDRAIMGEGGLLVVKGEAGIGKTSFADLTATYARLRKATLLQGRCESDAGAPGYWPWTQLLRQYVELAPADVLRADVGSDGPMLAGLVPNLDIKLGGDGEQRTASAEPSRFHLFDAVARLLQRAAAREPLILELEDIHWADPTSLLLLRFLLPHIRASRLLIVATLRTEASDDAETQALIDSILQAGVQEITLGGIGAADAAQFIQMTTGVEPRADLVAALVEKTEGNPFFLSEMVRLHVSEHGLDGLATASPADVPIPQSVEATISQRLSQLSPPTRDLLRAAAVAGREFDVRIIERAGLAEPQALAQALEEAEAMHLIAQSGDDPRHYRFRHALVSEVLYRSLSTARRMALHLDLGLALEAEDTGTRADRVAALAHHFESAARTPESLAKAIRYRLEEGDRAGDNLAYEAAADSYRRVLHAIEALADGYDTVRCRTLLSLGTVLWKGGALDASRAAFLDAVAAARKIGDASAFAEAAIGYGGLGYIGLWVTTGTVDRFQVDLLEEALARLPEADDPLRIRVLARLGSALYWDRSPERRDELTRSAVAMAERAGDAADRWCAQAARFRTLWSPDDLAERLDRSLRLVWLGTQAGSFELVAQARLWRLTALLEQGDIDSAEEELRAYQKVADELREPQYLWRARLLAAGVAQIHGDLEEMERLAFEAIGMSQGMTEAARLQAFALQIGVLRREQMRLSEIEGAVQQVIDRYPRLAAWRGAGAVMFCELGRWDDARAQLDILSADGFRAIPRDYLWLACMAMTADLAFRLGDSQRAGELYPLLAPYADRYVIVGDAVAHAGPASFYLGQLARTTRDWARAAEHFRAGIAQASHMRAPLDEARSRLGLAAVLGELGGHDADLEANVRTANQLARRYRSDALLRDATAIQNNFSRASSSP